MTGSPSDITIWHFMWVTVVVPAFGWLARRISVVESNLKYHENEARAYMPRSEVYEAIHRATEHLQNDIQEMKTDIKWIRDRLQGGQQ